jgi:hypothetical protein
MVAKSFQNMTQLCEPYSANGKMYVKVRNEKTGTERQVRWYSENEYAKLYPEEKIVVAATPKVNPQKEVLGFTKGYITIFKGKIEENLEWFEDSNARYCRWWGWYIISTEDVPADLPQGIETIKLDWANVGNENGLLKSDEEIKKFVESLNYKPTNSEYVGSIGERLDLVITVIENTRVEGYHGYSVVHVFEDGKGNQFIWTTSAKDWQQGETKHIRGTVKEYQFSKGNKQTVLTRCTEVK